MQSDRYVLPVNFCDNRKRPFVPRRVLKVYKNVACVTVEWAWERYVFCEPDTVYLVESGGMCFLVSENYNFEITVRKISKESLVLFEYAVKVIGKKVTEVERGKATCLSVY